MRESKIEKYFKNEVEALGGKSYKFTSPQNRGVSDQVVCWPNGETHFIELKSAKGKPSALQEVFRFEVKQLNQVHHYLFSKDDVDDYIFDMKRRLKTWP
ncbi:VRR-NUC domain-containing protein [Macrococcus capreoli]|uniref:VRR-NUC domain-containing protein n=1 Tax=Macrococcus capreoli TaxID=2982690 RepID=UPI003EE70FD9